MTPSDTPCTNQEYKELKAKKSRIQPIYTQQLQVYGKTKPVKPMRPDEQEQTLYTDKDLSKSNKIACLCVQQAWLHQLAYMGVSLMTTHATSMYLLAHAYNIHHCVVTRLAFRPLSAMKGICSPVRFPHSLALAMT